MSEPAVASTGVEQAPSDSAEGVTHIAIARSISPSSAREGVLVDTIRAGEPAKCHQIGGCTRRSFQARLHVTLPSVLSGSPHAQRPADGTPSMVQHRCSTNYTKGASNRRKQNRAKRPGPPQRQTCRRFPLHSKQMQKAPEAVTDLRASSTAE